MTYNVFGGTLNSTLSLLLPYSVVIVTCNFILSVRPEFNSQSLIATLVTDVERRLQIGSYSVCLHCCSLTSVVPGAYTGEAKMW